MTLPSLSLLGVGAVVGIVVAFWKQLSEAVTSIWSNLRSLLLVTVIFEDRAMYSACVFLVKKAQRVSIGEFVIKGQQEYVKSLRRDQIVAMRSIPRSTSFWRLGRKIMAIKRDWYSLNITYLRWQFSQVELVKAVMAEGNAVSVSNRFMAVRKQGTVGNKPKFELIGKGNEPGDNGFMDMFGNMRIDHNSAEIIGWDPADIGRDTDGDPLGSLALPDEALHAVAAARTWQKEESWYKDRGIPWKLGWLLHGPPGTGKTAFAVAMAKDLDIPMFLVDLASMTNNDLIKAWSEIAEAVPCMVAFEDIHAVFNKSERICNTGSEPGVTYDCLLNILDGAMPSDGVLTVITTNELSAVGVALGGPDELGVIATRPGRVDRVIGFGNLSKSGKLQIARRIFAGLPEARWMPCVEATFARNMTGAAFQDMCAACALKLKLETP